MLPIPSPVDAHQVPDAEGVTPGEYHRLMLTAAAKAGVVGFGADGTIEGCTEVVPAERLYTDPRLDKLVTFTPEEIERCAASLRARGQVNEIHVLKVPNPHSDFPSRPEDLLIVDLDGMLLWRAAAQADLPDYRVRIHPFTGDYWRVILDAVGRKSRQFSLRQLTLGRLVKHALALHAQEHPEAEPLTITDVAPDIGYSSSYLSRCVDADNQPQPIIDLLETNQLTFEQVKNEILSIDDEAERIRVAQQIAAGERSTLAKPKTSPGQRITLPQNPMHWDAGDIVVDQHDLLLAHVDWEETTTASYALGVLLRDVKAVLAKLKIDYPAPFIRHLQTAIAAKEAQQLITEAASAYQ